MKEIFKSLVVKVITFEAKVILRRHKPTIVAITGNVGKTSTKDAIYAAIKTQVSVRKSEKSFNSEIGVPLTVLGLSNAWSNPFLWAKNIIEGFFFAFFSRSYAKVLILEMGVDHPGDMQTLTKWVKPDIVVLTRLPDVPVHVEFFSSPEAVVEEKMKLIESLKVDGMFVYNADDTIIESKLPEVLQKTVSFGRYLDSDYKVVNDSLVYKDDKLIGTKFKVSGAGKTFSLSLVGTAGTQSAYAAAAALATTDALELDVSIAAKNLNSFLTPPGRMRIIPGIKSTLIIDDTYNASPTAAEVALQTLQEIKYAKRKIAVLGDMMELGKFSADEHKKIGERLKESDVDILLTIGVRSRQIAEGALAVGMQEENIFQYDDVARAGRELQALLESGDVVLVKASQSIRAERIVEEVMNEPGLAESLLVRQGSTWKKM